MAPPADLRSWIALLERELNELADDAFARGREIGGALTLEDAATAID